MVNKLIAWIVAGVGFTVAWWVMQGGIAFLAGNEDMMWLFTIIFIGMNAGSGGDLMGNITSGLQDNMVTFAMYFVAAAVSVIVYTLMMGGAVDIMMAVKGGLAASVSGILTAVWFGAAKAGV